MGVRKSFKTPHVIYGRGLLKKKIDKILQNLYASPVYHYCAFVLKNLIRYPLNNPGSPSS